MKNGILKITAEKRENNREWHSTACNERFGVMAAEARRKCSANLQLPAPQEVQWKPPLRQAATTLAAMAGQRHRKSKKH